MTQCSKFHKTFSDFVFNFCLVHLLGPKTLNCLTITFCLAPFYSLAFWKMMRLMLHRWLQNVSKCHCLFWTSSRNRTSQLTWRIASLWMNWAKTSPMMTMVQ